MVIDVVASIDEVIDIIADRLIRKSEVVRKSTASTGVKKLITGEFSVTDTDS